MGLFSLSIEFVARHVIIKGITRRRMRIPSSAHKSCKLLLGVNGAG